MTKEERAKKAKSMNFTFDDENDGTPIKNSDFLNSADPVPEWFRHDGVDRLAAEAELKERGKVDGRFLVRVKLRTSARIVLALSLTYSSKYYHHLLARQKQGQWSIDEKAIDFSEGLEDVIAYLQKRKNPRLACVLEADGTDGTGGGSYAAKPKAAGGAARRNSQIGKPAVRSLVPGNSSSVDDVVMWLASMGMGKYAGNFYKGKVDGKKLHGLNEKALRKLVKTEDDYRMMVRALR